MKSYCAFRCTTFTINNYYIHFLILYYLFKSLIFRGFSPVKKIEPTTGKKHLLPTLYYPRSFWVFITLILDYLYLRDLNFRVCLSLFVFEFAGRSIFAIFHSLTLSLSLCYNLLHCCYIVTV